MCVCVCVWVGVYCRAIFSFIGALSMFNNSQIGWIQFRMLFRFFFYFIQATSNRRFLSINHLFFFFIFLFVCLFTSNKRNAFLFWVLCFFCCKKFHNFNIYIYYPWSVMEFKIYAQTNGISLLKYSN